MSHFVKVQTKFRDADAIKAVLRHIYPEASEVEHSATPLPTRGYRGDVGAPCNIVVRSKWYGMGLRAHIDGGLITQGFAGGRLSSKLGPCWGDVGFVLEKDGTYTMHADDMDTGTTDRIAQEYAREVAVKQATAQGYTLTEEKVDGVIHLKLSKWS